MDQLGQYFDRIARSHNQSTGTRSQIGIEGLQAIEHEGDARDCGFGMEEEGAIEDEDGDNRTSSRRPKQGQMIADAQVTPKPNNSTIHLADP
jgi:hypothetical protein